MSEVMSICQKYAPYFKVGAAVNPYLISRYGELIKKHFSSLTCENEMKPSELHPERAVYAFERADKVADFAREANIPMRGHTFVWHGQTPRWFFEGATKETLFETLTDHIKTVSSRYGDIIYAWDVVNEAINDHPDGGALRARTPYLPILGEDYLYEVFKLAKSILPEGVDLVYNDYNESDPLKRTRIAETVKSINRDGQLVNVVGMQCHWRIDEPSLDRIRETFELYASLGCHIQVTELDVSMHKWNEPEGTEWYTPERVAAHAKYYGDIFRLFREYADVIDSVTLWGVTDGASWLNGFPVKNRPDKALIFNDDGTPKDAYYEIMDF